MRIGETILFASALSLAWFCALAPWLLPSPSRPAYLPDPRLTPGAVVALDAGAICDRGYAGRARHVTEADKKAALARYGIPWARRAEFEVDHLIPLAVGGSNAPENLWPQPWAGPLGAREKDRLEVRLRSLVCAGTMTLEAAQAAFRGDWTAAYRAQGLDLPRQSALPDGGDAYDEPDREGFGPDDDGA